MKKHQNKGVKALQIEIDENSKNNEIYKKLDNNKNIQNINNGEGMKYFDFIIKDSSEDILTSFKTKTNPFNTNCLECGSIDSSLEEDSSINYLKTGFDCKLGLSESSKNDYIYINNDIDEYCKFGYNDKDNPILANLQNKENEKETEKIDYKYYTKFINIKNIIEYFKKNNISSKNYYWLATYDKLMKRKKLLKILNFSGKNYDEKKILEKCIKIEEFELFYNSYCENPLIRPANNIILVKLYLLDNEQINDILNYLNHSKTKLDISKITNYYRNDKTNKGKYNILFSNYKNYPYPLLYYLGNYLNINIISFSNFYYKITNNYNKNIINKSLKNNIFPSSKKLSKFIKLLMLNFQHVSKNLNYFVFYSVGNLKFNNFNQKYFEILQLVNSKKFNDKEKQKNGNEEENNILLSNINIEKDIYKKFYKLSSLEISNNTSSIINSNNSKMINSNFNSILSDSSFFDNSLIKSFHENKYLKNNIINDKNYQKSINSIKIIDNNDNNNNNNNNKKSESIELSKKNKSFGKNKTPQIKRISKNNIKLDKAKIIKNKNNKSIKPNNIGIKSFHSKNKTSINLKKLDNVEN